MARQIMNKILDGNHSVSDLMGLRHTLMVRRQVMAGVSDMVAGI